MGSLPCVMWQNTSRKNIVLVIQNDTCIDTCIFGGGSALRTCLTMGFSMGMRTAIDSSCFLLNQGEAKDQ